METTPEPAQPEDKSFKERTAIARERLANQHELRTAIGRVLLLQQTAAFLDDEAHAAGADLERLWAKWRAGQDYQLEVKNLPPDTYVVSASSDRIIDDAVTEFTADDIRAGGRQGIDLINGGNGTRVRIELSSNIDLKLVLDDAAEVPE